jgi:hypothetical protein
VKREVWVTPWSHTFMDWCVWNSSDIHNEKIPMRIQRCKDIGQRFTGRLDMDLHPVYVGQNVATIVSMDSWSVQTGVLGWIYNHSFSRRKGKQSFRAVMSRVREVRSARCNLRTMRYQSTLTIALPMDSAETTPPTASNAICSGMARTL